MKRLKAVFTEGVTELTLDNLTQWDKDVLLHILAPKIPKSFEIHIGYEGISKTYQVPFNINNNEITISIPNELLQQTKTIKTYIYEIDKEGHRTEKTINIPITKREKPVGYIYEPTEIIEIREIVEQTIDTIKTQDGTIISPNNNYAEVGEWADGNTDDEYRIGYFVSIAGTTMVKSKSTSDVRGVTVLAPAFSDNCPKDKFDTDGNLLKKYNYVATMGLVSVVDNGTCTINERCMPDDNGCAIPSTNNMGYKVIDRIDDTHILIVLEPTTDMIQRIKTDIDILNQDIGGKVDKIEGYTLLSPTDKTKLDALVIGEGGAEISGEVDATKVKGLDNWITTNRDIVAGLFDTTSVAAIKTLETLVGNTAVATQIANAITTEKSDLIGTDTDTAISNTIKGAKKYADSLNIAMDTRMDTAESKLEELSSQIPTKTSELSNDSGYLTLSDLPIYNGGVE